MSVFENNCYLEELDTIFFESSYIKKNYNLNFFV